MIIITLHYIAAVSDNADLDAVQCRCWSHGRVRHAKYRSRENEIRRSRRHVSDGQDTSHPATRDGPERGI